MSKPELYLEAVKGETRNGAQVYALTRGGVNIGTISRKHDVVLNALRWFYDGAAVGRAVDLRVGWSSLAEAKAWVRSIGGAHDVESDDIASAFGSHMSAPGERARNIVDSAKRLTARDLSWVRGRLAEIASEVAK